MKTEACKSWHLQSVLLCILVSAVACAQSHPSLGTSSEGHASTTGHADIRVLPAEKLTSGEVDCIHQVLTATTIAEVNRRFRACKDSPSLRMAYAYVQLKLHSPHADDKIIKAIPDSLAAMRQLYSFSGTSVLSARAYEGYYNHLFILGKRKPELLPTLFAVAAQYGTDNPNVDEDAWFCDELARLYKNDPTEYIQAVKTTKNPFFRRVAMDCRSEPNVP